MTNIETSEDRFRGIIEHALDIITLTEADGTVLYTSPAFARLLGYEPWEVLGQSFLDFVHEEDRDVLRSMLGADGGVEFRFRHKDGRWRIIQSVVSNLLHTEAVKAIVLNSRDVTGQKEAEKELKRYRSHLEELVEQRTRELTAALEGEKKLAEQQRQFISMVSHEFRTPLTVIDGNAQIIQTRGPGLGAEVLERRGLHIRNAVARLIRLIETVLSHNVLESGKLTIQKAPCELIKIIRDVCVERLDVAPEHKIRLDIGKLPRLNLDEKVIHQVMVNLISNAVKYSPGKKQIDVSAKVEGAEVVIKITDYGVGIPEKELPKLFSRYFRASTSGNIPGSGLGLSLVKEFIALHDGVVEVESQVDVGTTVTVKLPIEGKEA